MSLIINTNAASIMAQQQLSRNSKAYQQSLARLSSGKRLNSAADDAAGLTISQNLTGQIRRMKQASRNVQDGISILQITEGALSTISENLQRVRELTVQAANDTNSTASRDAIEEEVRALLNDVNRIAGSTNFNQTPLLSGSATNAVLHIGPDSDPVSNTLDITSALSTATSSGLGLTTGSSTFASINGIDFTTASMARAFLNDVDTAITRVINQRSTLGSFQNQLESTANNLEYAIENFSASNSRIRDLDIAEESANMVQSQILQEASVNVLAQTNKLPQMILSLLNN